MPLKRTSLVDQLVSTIQHELITGQYPAGTAFCGGGCEDAVQRIAEHDA